ncbi:MAG: hypothetical protein LLF96_11825 [Eubacteriales bacterium]|nr:hypothetical protein [Eubacteriales bacterium]
MKAEARGVAGRGNAVFSTLAGLLFLLTLAVVALGQSAFAFAYPRTYVWPNWAILLAVLALLSLTAWVRRFFTGRARRPLRWGWLLAVYFLFLLAAQMLVTRSLWFYAGWDVQSVYETAGRLVRGEAFDSTYFALCPNNSVITLLLTVPLWAATRLGLAVPYAVLPYVSALLTNLACLFCVLCVIRLTGSRLARLGALLLCTVWIAFSLTVTVPYTDTFSVLFPVLALYVFLSRLRAFPKWLLISLLCFLGAAVKPTVMIVGIALMLISALRLFPLSGMNRRRWRSAGAILAAIVLGAVPGKLLQNAANTVLAGSAQPQGQLCETHYLMLGMNDETYGGHSDEDNVFSLSYPTLQERRSANLQEAWRRFTARGVAGNLRFFAIKLYKAYSDGTLAANTSYLVLERPARSDAASVFLRTLYDKNSNAGVLIAMLMQGVWFAILLLCAAAFWGKGRREAVTASLGLTLLGVTAYLLLFEAWPRYLFLYAPLFVIAAALGLQRLRLPMRALKITKNEGVQ